MDSLSEFVDGLQSIGRYTFSKQEALQSWKATSKAFDLAAVRLQKKGRLESPRSGFFIIIPTEYLGTIPPPTWFVHDMMKFLNQPYYIGLLSAGAFHGAAHHQPQEFHIITNKPTRKLLIKNSRIRFFKKKELLLQFTKNLKGPTGPLVTSNPELTALDLVFYASKIGGLDLVGTVLFELAEVMNPKELVKVAKEWPSLSSIQRLGFILDHLELHELSKPLLKWFKKQNGVMVPLALYKESLAGPRNTDWLIIENDELEIET